MVTESLWLDWDNNNSGESRLYGVESLSKLVSYSFQFFDTHPVVKSDGSPAYPDADGMVSYEILTVWGSIDGKDHTLYLRQLFSKDGLKPGKNNVDNIWQWDGNRENPTIRPSFLVPDYHFHCYVTNGKIDVLSDSRVENVAKRMTWDEFMGRQTP